MSFLDFLKTKQKRESGKPAKTAESVRSGEKGKKPAKAALKAEKSITVPIKSAGLNAAAFQIMRRPRITEKAGIAGEQNKYIFEVYKNANKPEVKKAVEEIYGKDVEKVRIINIPPKKRRRGRIEYYKSGLKKAIVTLREGETIEVMPR